MLIAGGGTGGHLFPGIALAQEVTTRHPENDVLFVGTARGLEARVVPEAGFKLELIEVGGLKRVGLLGLLRGLLRIPKAMLQSRRILKRYLPDVVMGVGGYASGPVVLMAWLMGIPTAVQEQNARAGFTNKLLGKFVQAVFVAFKEVVEQFPAGKTRLLGNPIRRELMDNFLRAKAQHDRFRLLVFGGSQGAHAINTTFLRALPLLGDVKDQLAITHQTGKKDVDEVRQGYAGSGFEVEVLDFISDMSKAYSSADLVLCRAGATTLAELTVCKKPAILVPFPFAADNHQEINARSLAEAGAAVMILEAELTPEKLAETIRGLIADRPRLARMEKAAGLLGRPEAAKEITDVCVELVERRWGSIKGRAAVQAGSK
jgi:UDP-N-acetylglucosamine--N-acetylmuramyl-(pentapeptide) pyrophosphoryl-undecaprenol N-acetylglucosamine transferase